MFPSPNSWASLIAQMVKRLPTIQETRVRSLGREDPLEKEMATHSSIYAWKILHCSSHPILWLCLEMGPIRNYVHWGHRMGPWSDRISILIRRDTREFTVFLSLHICTEKGPCEDAVRRWPSASQEESSQLIWNQLKSWSGTPSFQNYEKINFCYIYLITQSLVFCYGTHS